MLTEKDYALDPEEISESKARVMLNEFYLAARNNQDTRAREKAFEFIEYLSENQLLDGTEAFEAGRILLELQED